MAVDRHDEGHEPMPEGDEPPPPGVRLMSLVRWGILAAAVVLAAFMWISYAKAQLSGSAADASLKAPRYHCPMHPQIVGDEPGECPICHMALEPISDARSGALVTPPVASSATPPAGSGQASGFSCPMHPEVRSETAGRCPVCKMALAPIAASVDAGVAGEHGAVWGSGMLATAADAGMPSMLVPGATPPGTTTVDLALDRVQAIGVRTAVAEERDAGRALRVTAVVTAPEQGAAEVHVRSAGFVEAIHVDQSGMKVRAGQPMLALYSAEILQAQNELLATRGWGADGGSMTVSARRKLELLGMSQGDIDRVVARGEPLRAITITTPRGGYVTKKNVVLGSYVTPETTLYEVQDLSTVYVVADVFLPDVPYVKVGSEARFVPARDSERAATGRVDLVYPVVNPEARTRRIRMQIRNEGGVAYTPGEYGMLELTAAPRRRVSIPSDALVDTGTATYVFVVAGEGRFVPRAVSVAGTDRDRVFIEGGLSPGERVVSGATFLVDAESRLRASIAQASGTATKITPTAPTTGQGPSCHADFDRQTKPDKWAECMKCETVHRGMGSMEVDCKNAIAKPWK
jgi:membrane fusion protein, copper/silver efflux system